MGAAYDGQHEVSLGEVLQRVPQGLCSVRVVEPVRGAVLVGLHQTGCLLRHELRTGGEDQVVVVQCVAALQSQLLPVRVQLRGPVHDEVDPVVQNLLKRPLRFVDVRPAEGDVEVLWFVDVVRRVVH